MLKIYLKHKFFFKASIQSLRKVFYRYFTFPGHLFQRVDEREVKRSSQAALGLLRWLEAIAGFSTTYTKMKPILKQLEAAEADLMHIQKELGHARVALGHLKLGVREKYIIFAYVRINCELQNYLYF